MPWHLMNQPNWLAEGLRNADRRRCISWLRFKCGGFDQREIRVLVLVPVLSVSVLIEV